MILKANKFAYQKSEFKDRWDTFFQLDFQERVIFYLKFRENFSFTEISDVLDVTYWGAILDYFSAREKFGEKPSFEQCSEQAKVRLSACKVSLGQSDSVKKIEEHLGSCKTCRDEFSRMKKHTYKINELIPKSQKESGNLIQMINKMTGEKPLKSKGLIQKVARLFP